MLHDTQLSLSDKLERNMKQLLSKGVKRGVKFRVRPGAPEVTKPTHTHVGYRLPPSSPYPASKEVLARLSPLCYLRNCFGAFAESGW